MIYKNLQNRKSLSKIIELIINNIISRVCTQYISTLHIIFIETTNISVNRYF